MENKELGTRDNKGKLKWSLVDYKALEPMVRVLMQGEEHYGRDNWKKGLPYTEICESLLRHVYSFLDGNNRDSKSKLLEVGHILCNALFLSYMVLFRPDLDDRPTNKNNDND